MSHLKLIGLCFSIVQRFVLAGEMNISFAQNPDNILVGGSIYTYEMDRIIQLRLKYFKNFIITQQNLNLIN
jgi:hypothetical protein